MSITSSYGRVTLTGSLYPDGEIIEQAKVDSLGESPNAIAKLYQWQQGSPTMPGRWREIDRLLSCTIQRIGDTIVYDGTSEQLTAEVGLAEADAKVRWEYSTKECTTCS